MLSPRRIIHIDMDAFYASVEQRDNPALRGLPLAVGGARARGVVAAASYEARKFGVRSAMASTLALRKCPELIFVPPRFEAYRAVSQQIHTIFENFTAIIEPLSLDEAYLDVTDALDQHGSATAIAEEIRRRIKTATGLTASAGVSYNKLLAKLASDHRKPDGLFVITPAMGPDFVADLKVEKFHGIGPATAAKMNQLGIHTGLDLRARPLEFLRAHFGKAGGFYHGIARGDDPRPVSTDRARKSMGAENTFAQDLHQPEEMLAALAPLIARVWQDCTERNLTGRTVTLKIKFDDFRQVTRSRSMPGGIASHALFGEAIGQLLTGLLPVEHGVRLLGVSVASFGENEKQGSLLF